MSQFLKFDSNKPAAALLELLIKKSIELRASDLHIDPLQDKIRIRLRVDGKLFEFVHLDISRHSEIIGRIKILSGLRIDEHLKAQDGRFKINFSSSSFIDVRVSILPTYYGENAVLRLLSDQSKFHDLKELGFDRDDFEKIKKAISKQNGLILVTGPTGSGKTTTLYSIIQILNKVETSIITIEDPIEYSIKGVRQIQVNKQSNLGFADALRSVLRQDPNIIMVGEIRDRETAALSINAALTGHLVLSTLHTSDAAAALPRLIDMAVEPFLLASIFNIALNQRLVRKICVNCKFKEKLSVSQKKYLEKIIGQEIPSDGFYKGRGCQSCEGGYWGRLVVAEILTANEDLRAAIFEKKPASQIRRLAVKDGMETIMQNAFKKARSGLTSLEEIFAILHE